MFPFRIIAALPKNILPFIAWFVSVIILLTASKNRRVIQQNLERVYQLPPHSTFSKLFVRQVVKTQVLLALETIRYVFRPGEVYIGGLDEARAVLQTAAQDSGVVITAAHHGAWELAGHAAARCLPRDFYALAKPSSAPWFTRVLNEIREKLGMKVLWTDSKSLLKDMMVVAQKNGHLGFVMDQRPGKRVSGHPSRFLGVDGTQIVQGPAMMAARKNMPVYGVHVMRVGTCRYHFYATEVLRPNHGLKDEAHIAQLMADDLSRMIFRYPEQWAWNYRRWK